MSVFWLPYDYESELKILNNLLRLDWLDSSKKSLIAKYKSELENFGFVSNRHREYVDGILSEYGVYL